MIERKTKYFSPMEFQDEIFIREISRNMGLAGSEFALWFGIFQGSHFHSPKFRGVGLLNLLFTQLNKNKKFSSDSALHKLGFMFSLDLAANFVVWAISWMMQFSLV